MNSSTIGVERRGSPGFQAVSRLPEEERPGKRRRPRLVRAGVGAAAVWLVMVVVQVALAGVDARAGRSELEGWRGALAAGRLETAGAEEALGRARASFDSAVARVGAPFVKPALVVPVLGRQLQSFTAMSQASGDLAHLAASTLGSVRHDLATAASGGPGRVEALVRVSQTAARTERMVAAVDLGPERHLLAPLAAARGELADLVGEARSTLDRAGEMTGVVAELLEGPRRYLLLVANNAEMRAGSGMFLSASILESRQGTLTLGPMRPTAELALAGSGLEGPPELQERWGWLGPGREWRNLGVSPRFDVTGELAARMWQAVDGTPVDGVLALDVETLRAVLAATGPVEVGDASLDAGTVVEYLLHDQYLELADTAVPGDVEQQERRDQLADLAQAAFEAVDAGSYDFGVLASELAGAASGRHLLAWSADAEVQQAWERAGISGTMHADSLLVAVLNRGGNKLDRFLEVAPQLGVQPGPGATDVAVEVTLRNGTPAGEPAYVAGPHPLAPVAKGDYLGIVSVSVPGSAFDLTIDGGPPVVAGGPDGPTQVIATPVLVPAGADHTLVVRFRLPADHRSLQVEPSARIPAQQWRMGTVVWQAETPRRFQW